MKLISFLSKFTFICNLCFLIFVVLNRIDAKKQVAGVSGTVIAFPFFKDLVIILGVSAIIINLAMCLVYLVTILTEKSFLLPKWIAITNFIFLIVQVYFFFL